MEVDTNTKISLGFVLSLAVGTWAMFGYLRDVEAMIANEKTQRQKLEERVAWVIVNGDKQDVLIERIDQNVRANGKTLAKILAIADEEDDL